MGTRAASPLCACIFQAIIGDMTDHRARAPLIDLLLAAAVIMAGALLRTWELATPARPVFDEIYYAVNGCLRVLGAAACGTADFASLSHPPGGELLIGSGQLLFGVNALGWRLPSVVAGTALIGVTYLIARVLAGRLLTSARPALRSGVAVGAAALVALDGMAVAMSRVAMLDIFVALFITAALAAALLDRPQAGFRRGALIGAGALLGFALAIKWSALLAVPMLVGLVWAQAPSGTRWSATWRGVAVAAAAAGIVYVAIFVTSLEGSPTQWPFEFAQRHWRMLSFHRGLEGHHPYESGPLGWLLLQRPVVLYFASGVATDGSTAWRYLMAAGNPVIWWGGALAALGLVATARQRGYLALLPLAGTAALLLPWVALSGGRSAMFGYYLLPALPLLAVAAALAGGMLIARRSPAAIAFSAGFVIAVALVAALLLPLSVGRPLSPAEFIERVPFDCPPASSAPQLAPDDEIQSGPAPIGWCWG